MSPDAHDVQQQLLISNSAGLLLATKSPSRLSACSPADLPPWRRGYSLILEVLGPKRW